MSEIPFELPYDLAGIFSIGTDKPNPWRYIFVTVWNPNITDAQFRDKMKAFLLNLDRRDV